MGELLRVEGVNVYYGSIHAIKDVSFHVDEGEIVTMIGANGAGKTTTMHAISGLLKIASGTITYDGKVISRIEPHKIVSLGLAQTRTWRWAPIPGRTERTPSRMISIWFSTFCRA